MKPILFNTEMVRAILEGRKTVTRRVIKPQPTYSPRDGFTWNGYAFGTDLPPTIKGAGYNLRCVAPYKVGDVLYVRETYTPAGCGMCEVYECYGSCGCPDYLYKADFGEYDLAEFKENGYNWKPSIHMPKEAARLFLRVTGVRVERLQDIKDPEGEGIVADYTISDAEERYYKKLIDFSELWDSTIKKDQLDTYSWRANPYVWVIEFEDISEDIKNGRL